MRLVLRPHWRAIRSLSNNPSPVFRRSPLRALCCTTGHGNDNGKDEESAHNNRSERSRLSDEEPDSEQIPVESLLGFSPEGEGEEQDNEFEEFGCRYGGGGREEVRAQAERIFEILARDGPGFNAREALDQMPVRVRVSNALVREVLFKILISINHSNKSKCAKMAYKFFVWSSSRQSDYAHNSSVYNLTMKIFAECEKLSAMWQLLGEMLKKDLPVTARTFNILISTCLQSGVAKEVIERFIMARTFYYRPLKNSFNAILHTLLGFNQYRLIEWVYQKMLLEGHSPNVLTYNIIMRAKYMLGKVDQFHRLMDEMGRKGLTPDLHTYNLLLHVLGKGDKPLAALNLLNYMRDTGCQPSVLHFTNLIDGLSRAGNLDACEYFYNEMVKSGCEPDVVCYTVMITSYVLAGRLEHARDIFNQMLANGHLPNVYTYNSMIKGLCAVGRFKEACDMLREMDSRGCVPNFSVYCNLVRRLRNAGKVAEATGVVNFMIEKGQYLHLVSRFKFYNNG